MSAVVATQVLASRWKRLGGALIDGMISLVVILPVLLTTGTFSQLTKGESMSMGEQALYQLLFLLVFLVLNGYLLATRGQTIGKVIVRTKIVDLQGQKPSLAKIVGLRALPQYVVGVIPVVGGFVLAAEYLIIFGKDKRCLHDYLAGTRVVDAETPLPLGIASPQPPSP